MRRILIPLCFLSFLPSAFSTERMAVNGVREEAPQIDYSHLFGGGGGGGGGGDYGGGGYYSDGGSSTTESAEKDPNEPLTAAEVASLTTQLREMKNIYNKYLLTHGDYLDAAQKQKIEYTAARIDKMLGWLDNTATITGLMVEQKYEELLPEVAGMIAGSYAASTIFKNSTPLVRVVGTLLTEEATKTIVEIAQKHILIIIGPTIKEMESQGDFYFHCNFLRRRGHESPVQEALDVYCEI